jgi:hypothetical protein
MHITIHIVQQQLIPHHSPSFHTLSNAFSKSTGVSKWAGIRYFYPSEIVYSTGRNYWTPPKLAVVKTTSMIGLWNIFHKKLMITSIAEFSHSNRTTASRPSWWDIPCFKNQRLSRACIVHLVIKKTNWSYVKTMSCVILELRST